MARIAVSRTMEAPTDRVWAAMADLGSHVEWMKDARSIVFTTDQREGVGTRTQVETRVGPLRTLDIMEVVGWEEGKSIEVAHRGLVKGRGTLAATPLAQETLVTWEEELTFPWWLGGGVTAWLARPVLAAVWRGNLRRLERSLTSP
ncbi:MAG: SRPBCC family protein [Actinomycetota bacterium]